MTNASTAGSKGTSRVLERVPAPSIRILLGLLVAVCILPASLMAAYLIVEGYKAQRAQLVSGTIATARAMASTLDRDLAGSEAGLNVLAASPLLLQDNLAGFYGYAKKVLPSQNVSTYVLIEPGGRQVLNTLRPYGDVLPGFGSPQLRSVFVTGKAIITDVFIGPVTGKPIIAMGVPVRRDGKVVYVLSVGIFPARVEVLLQQQRLPAGWIGVVLDATGTIIARTRDMNRFVGKKAVPDLVEAARAASEGTIETVSLEGIPVVTAFSRSEVSNWTVAVGIPKSDLTNELKKSLWSLVVTTVVLLAVGLWMAWHVGTRIARAIHGLVDPALELGSGTVVTVPALHLKEADEVGQALMAASMLLLEAQHGANHDGLTGLPNRTLFGELLLQQLAVCQRAGSELSVLCIDLDGFKAVNDIHGHARGDELLRVVASRIKAAVRASDVAARQGGDEFMVLLVQSGAASARAVAVKLVTMLSAPYELGELGELKVHISASIGIATFPESAGSAELLLAGADAAMYAAKNAGRNAYAIADRADKV